jgi:hypothetical protein
VQDALYVGCLGLSAAAWVSVTSQHPMSCKVLSIISCPCIYHNNIIVCTLRSLLQSTALEELHSFAVHATAQLDLKLMNWVS